MIFVRGGETSWMASAPVTEAVCCLVEPPSEESGCEKKQPHTVQTDRRTQGQGDT